MNSYSGYGYGKESWGKQITARFRPAELAQLDALVAKAQGARSWPRQTRSSVIVDLVRAAAEKLPKTSPATSKKAKARR